MLKELLTNAHKLYCLACGLPVGQIPIPDESTPRSTNDGADVIYRPRGQRYHSQCVYIHTQWSYLFSVVAAYPVKGLKCFFVYITWTVFSISIAKRTGVLSKTPLIPVPARLFCSRNSFCSGMAIVTGRYRTH